MPKHDIQLQRRIVKLFAASWMAKRLMNHKKNAEAGNRVASFRHDAQSESQKPFNCKEESLGKKSPRLGLALR